MTNLHERINQLSDAQKAALQARLEQKRTIRPAGRSTSACCSFRPTAPARLPANTTC
ncbi:hypothetical protein [Burkholderia glumae]|uniref:hypothetical protein n=1 Tax=Burkholderia glumae TaxID=337 RepID=UPI002164EEF6|nr:hypothetical protein [Burkholderia glumae]